MGDFFLLVILCVCWFQFKALHWFEHVHARFNREASRVHQDVERARAQLAELQAKKGRFRKMGRKDRAAAAEKLNDDLQEVVLREKRLRGTQREYELLFYSMSGARIFFKEGKSSKEKAAAKHAEEEEARAAAAAHEDATVLPSASAGGGGLALPSF